MATLKVTYNEISQIVSKLESSRSKISDLWEEIKTKDIPEIKNSWYGQDCDFYIDKILEMDKDVKNALEAQRLLADTFKNARDQINETQNRMKNRIDMLR